MITATLQDTASDLVMTHNMLPMLQISKPTHKTQYEHMKALQLRAHGPIPLEVLRSRAHSKVHQETAGKLGAAVQH